MTAVHSLGIVVVFTALQWIPYVLERLVSQGVKTALSNPEPDAPSPAAWARRAQAAHANSIENLALFAPAVWIAHVSGHADAPFVVGASVVYVLARVLHYAIYTAGVPYARTVVFAGGWAAILGVVLGSM